MKFVVTVAAGAELDEAISPLLMGLSPAAKSIEWAKLDKWIGYQDTIRIQFDLDRMSATVLEVEPE